VKYNGVYDISRGEIMPDLFEILFDIDDHVAIHSWEKILVCYAEGNGPTAAQIKNKLIDVYSLNAAGQNKFDAIINLIDAETGLGDKVARATFIGAVCLLREGEFVYETNQDVKTRLGF